MNIVTLDFETFWSTTHTLKKMNAIEYCMHPDTEIISCAMKINSEKSQCVFGEAAVREMFDKVDWSDAFVVGHNMSEFDAILMAWRFGIQPRVWGCTLAMARPRFAKTVGLSLAALVKHFGIGVKNNAALLATQGKHLADFTLAERRAMAIYNCDDTDQCFELFKCLRPDFSTAELWHLDSKIRMLVDVQFDLDIPLLESALVQERKNKRKSLLTLAHMFERQVNPTGGELPESEDYLVERVRALLASAPMFSQLLEQRGVTPPMKESKTNPEIMIPALAKTDKEFTVLLDHEDEIVAMAAAARLSVKSTQTETRIQKFLDTAAVCDGMIPVPVSYCGADTTGRSSGWIYNMLNLPKLKKDKPRPSDALRTSIMAPPGHVIVVVDASGIEMRVNHFLWNVSYSTSLWKSKPDADIYKPTAAKFYGIDVSEVDSAKRQVGKVQQLACGFGCGHVRYVDMARTQGGLILLLEESKAQVDSWREMTPEIAERETGGWARLQTSLSWIMQGIERPVDPRGLIQTRQDGFLLTGSGRMIRYPALRTQRTMRQNPVTGKLREEVEMLYGEKRHTARIYGPKADENCVQAIARDIVYDAALEIFKRTKARPALEVYDELAYVVPEDKAEAFIAICHEEMRRSPRWFPDIVLWSEGDIGQRYSDAK